MGEFWFEVQTPTEVVAGDGSTLIGMLKPGRRYRAVNRDDHWVTVPGPDKTFGFVPITGITVLPDTSTEPLDPPEAPTTEPGSGAGTSQGTTTNGLAVASMVFGILWLAFVGSLVAVVLGHVSLRQIDRSEGRQDGRVFAVVGLALGYLGLAVFVVLAAFTVVNQEGEAVSRPLLPDRELSLVGITSEMVRFVEAPDGTAVLFNGGGSVSMTFNSSGGPVYGNFGVALGGKDDAGNAYVVIYEGELVGTYDAETGSLEGTVVITGEAPSGFEAVIPNETIWDGAVVVGSGGCAESGIQCAFGATQPDVDVYWEMPLPADAIDPAYVASLD